MVFLGTGFAGWDLARIRVLSFLLLLRLGLVSGLKLVGFELWLEVVDILVNIREVLFDFLNILFGEDMLWLHDEGFQGFVHVTRLHFHSSKKLLLPILGFLSLSV